LHQFFPRHYTGTEQFTFELASQMQRMGHSASILTYEPLSEFDDFQELTRDVMIRRYRYRTLPVIALRHKWGVDPTQVFTEPIAEAARKLSLACDLIHMSHPMWVSSFAKEYEKNSIPMVLTLTDAWLLCPSALLHRNSTLCNGPLVNGGCNDCDFLGPRMMPRLREARAVYDMADEIVTASRYLVSVFNNNGWTRRTKIIPHSLNYAYVKARKRNEQSDKAVFGFIGTLAWHKGAHVLIRAVREVDVRNIQVRIFGSPMDNPEYFNSLLQQANGDERIKFLGSFDTQQLPETMRGLNTLVIPSVYHENYPLVMLIALAYRVVPIVSNIGGMLELIRPGVNGFTFQTGNHMELASIIERIAKDPNVLEDLRGKITSPRRTEEEAIDYENIYRELAK
jgi:glycosyltransferase involved in cell wall biosynthesis